MTVLGGLQVDQEGNLANWMVPGKMVPGMGGAMDMVTGARNVIVAMEHATKDGGAKILKRCTLPLTAARKVRSIVTELAVFRFIDGQLVLADIEPGVTLENIRGEFAPVMPMQQLVHRRQRHHAAERGFELRLDLTDHQNAAMTRRFQERLEQFGFALVTEILTASPPAYSLAFVTNNIACDKLVSQTTRPSSGHTDGLCRLFQTQAVLKRKDDRLSLLQLLNRRRSRNTTKRTINGLLTSW